MRRTFVAAIFAIALLCAVLADEHTSSANLNTSTPTPIPRANITIRHTLDGVPFIVDSFLPDNAYVGNSRCGIAHIPELFSSAERIVDVMPWPWTGIAYCSTANEPIRICVQVAVTLGPGPFCTNPFLFTGDDVAVDLPWPASAWDPFPTVTAHFIRDGQPVPVTIIGWWFATGDAICDAHINPPHSSSPVVTTAVVISAYSVALSTGVSACGPLGTRRIARFTTQEFGDVEGTFDPAGADVTFDVDVGPSASVAPSLSPPPSPSPGSLPHTGGQADSNHVPFAAMTGCLIALAGATVLAGTWAGRKRRA